MGQGSIQKNVGPIRIFATVEGVHNLGLGLAYQKTFWTKIGGGLSQGSIQKNFGTSYVFLQPLKLATSNLVHKLSLALAYQKTTFWTKIGGGLGQGSIQKSWDRRHLKSHLFHSAFATA